MVGDIGQPTHLHYDMFYFYILPVTSYWCMLGVTLLLRMLYVMYMYTCHRICIRAFVRVGHAKVIVSARSPLYMLCGYVTRRGTKISI